MPDWIDGVPPEFFGQDRVWIVAEIPSRWNANSIGYRCFLWFGERWTDKEVFRASRWTMMILPPTTVA